MSVPKPISTMAKARPKLEIGSAAKALRMSHGYTQADAANRLEISTVALSKIENGHTSPSYPVLEKFREVYGIDPFVVAWSQASPGLVQNADLAHRISALRSTIQTQVEDVLRGVDAQNPTR